MSCLEPKKSISDATENHCADPILKSEDAVKCKSPDSTANEINRAVPSDNTGNQMN